MTKRTKENLGFFLLGAALTFIPLEVKFLQTRDSDQLINEQAQIINVYDAYWHITQDNDKMALEDWVMDGWDLEDNPIINEYDSIRQELVNITNKYESNHNHIHK